MLNSRFLALSLRSIALALGACQTAPEPISGALSSYDSLVNQDNSLRANIRARRDDAAATAIDRLVIEPAFLAGSAGSALTEEERRAVLREVDRQVCYELSERFALSQTPDQQAGRVRVAVTRIDPTGRVGSAASAVASRFIPGPIGVRAPGSTGGLSAEAEMLAPLTDAQVAAIVWSRNATTVGTEKPSLSRIGDAAQLAEPFGDAVGDAFAPVERPVRPIPDLDPCAAYGPRFAPAGFIAGVATGLYIPDLSGARPEQDEPEAD
jgi:hypothetical protein